MEREKSFGRILLAIDGSAQSEAALRATIELVGSTPTLVRVAHVVELEPHRDVETLVADTVARLVSAGARADQEIVRAEAGKVPGAIAAVAREFRADLIVLGSRGLSNWRSLFEHSVSHQVLAAVDCPVVITRTWATGDVVSTRRIMVAVAGGDDIGPAVRAASALARARRCSVLVVHVAQAIATTPGLAYIESDEEIQRTVEQTVQGLRDEGVAVEGIIAPAAPVAATLARVAEEWTADVIVTGSSRMGDAASLVLGSVSHDLLHTANVPVLIAERVRR